MAKRPEYPVMIPYNELCELLRMAKLVQEYRAEVATLNKQVVALRIMQQECFERLNEIQRSL